MSSRNSSILTTIIVVIIIGALLVSVLPSFSIQPQASEVWVNAAWAGTPEGTIVDGHTFGFDAAATITNGSKLAAPGGMVYVAAGTYNENVVIDHPLTLSGANAGVPANGARGDESIINGSGSIAIAITSNDVTIDGFNITDCFNAVNGTGDNARIVNNIVYSPYSYIPINGTGNQATITDNNIYMNSGMNVIVWYGDEATISRNYITGIPYTTVATETPGGVFIFNQGDGSVIADNHIEWDGNCFGGIRAIGNDALITGNNINITAPFNNLINVTGDRASVNSNVLKALGVYEGINVAGNDSTIDGNTVELVYGTYAAISFSDGSNGVITDNVIDVSAPDDILAPASDYHYHDMQCMIYYGGVAGTIERNQMTANVPFECGILYDDESLYGMPAGSATFPANGGVITDNTYSVPYSAGFIYYIGDAGTIQRNTDLSVNESRWPLVVYQAALFGHGTITDNTGGFIIYIGAELGLAPYGTISGNHVNSSLIGIAAIGDYNVINNNEINATIGTYTLGTKVLVDSNDYNAMSEYSYGPIPLSAGAIFDGDMCTVNNNTFDNFSIAVANVGLFQVIGIDASGAVTSQDTDKVNATLESTAADIAVLQQYAKDTIDKYGSAGTSSTSSYTAALSSLGYRGYGNSITNNKLNYDEIPGILGIATLGYNFTVDSNTFNCVNDSVILAGMIVGGDGGKVTNNYMSNVTLLGMYYGGLLKFEDGVYTSDLLGMDAQIAGNTVDGRATALSGLFPWGIIFTGYNAAIENNDLPGNGLGILTVQFEGSIVNNTVDAFNDGYYLIPLSVDAMGVKSMGSDGVSSLGGIISVCNNLTVTGNLVNGTLMGMLFVPIDPYTTWGNAYIVDNTLTNNAVQMAVVPAYFKARLSDGTVSTIDNATLQTIMAENTLDRKIYITDDTSELWDLDIVNIGYFQVDAIAVYGSLNVASLAAILVDGDGYTVNVKPGTYSLFMPVIVARSNLTYLGDPENPGNVIVDASSVSLLDSAFEIWADDANITGFTIVTGSPDNCGIAVGRLGSLLSSEDAGAESIVDDILGDILDTQASNVSISNNTISNFAAGVYLDNCTYTNITYNSITSNGVGIYLSNKSLSNSTEIHYNDIAGNLYYGVNYNDTIAVPDPVEDLWVHAENNWWGNATGPRDVTADPASTGTGDSITYYVLYDPPMMKPVLMNAHTYNLVAGWNLISVPYNVPDNDITDFFPAEVMSEVWDVWGWNAASQTWTYYSPDPNTPYTGFEPIVTMDAGKAYWVNMDSSASFTIEGSVPVEAPNAPFPLVSNWNFVGLTGTVPSTPDVMYPDAWDVWGWNAASQTWTYYSSDPNTPYTGFEPITEIQPGLGQWVNI